MDNWQPGDLALCVNIKGFRPDGWACLDAPLTLGGIYTIAALTAYLGHPCCLLEDFDHSGFDAGVIGLFRFRKIRPHTPDAEDAETIRLLNGQPVREEA